MNQMTISFKTKTGMTNIRHNNRDLSEEEFKSNEHRHINRALSHENITIIKRDIKEVYHDEFDDALNTYNLKQRRKDRKIEDYYKHVKKSKTLDLQREFVVSVGNKSDWEKMDFNKKRKVGEALASYVRDFNERHDHLVIYNAVVHLDEDGAPHAHFNVVPIADGYKNGLSKQPSFSKALLQEGFKEKGRGQLKQFRDHEIDRIQYFMKNLNIERKLGQTNDIKDMREYKETMRQIELQKQQEERELQHLKNEVRQKILPIFVQNIKIRIIIFHCIPDTEQSEQTIIFIAVIHIFIQFLVAKHCRLVISCIIIPAEVDRCIEPIDVRKRLCQRFHIC